MRLEQALLEHERDAFVRAAIASFLELLEAQP